MRPGLKTKEENKIKNLRNAINEGLKSGIARDFNAHEHLASLKSQKFLLASNSSKMKPIKYLN